MIKTESGHYFKYEIIGEFVSAGEWKHPERVIDSNEMIFVLEGYVSIEEDGTEYTLGANDVLILEPGKRHRGVHKSMVPTSFYWFHFYTDIDVPYKICRGKDFYDLKYLLKRLLHMGSSPEYAQEARDALGMLVLFEYLHASGNAEENSSLQKRIDEYIRINVRKNISAADVAEHFGYNADYIGRLFKRNHGVGLKEYIVAERLKRAKDLLLTTGLSIKEISAQLNCADENLFIKFFSYHEGISPAKFRNKYSRLHMNNG